MCWASSGKLQFLDKLDCQQQGSPGGSNTAKHGKAINPQKTRMASPKPGNCHLSIHIKTTLPRAWLVRCRTSPAGDTRQGASKRPFAPSGRKAVRCVPAVTSQVCFVYCARGKCASGDDCPLRHPPKEDAAAQMNNAHAHGKKHKCIYELVLGLLPRTRSCDGWSPRHAARAKPLGFGCEDVRRSASAAFLPSEVLTIQESFNKFSPQQMRKRS